MNIGKKNSQLWIRARNIDGDILDCYSIGSYETSTDVPVKARWEVGQDAAKEKPKTCGIEIHDKRMWHWNERCSYQMEKLRRYKSN